jgi:hypothetical protein
LHPYVNLRADFRWMGNELVQVLEVRARAPFL